MPTLQEVSQSILAGIGITNPSESQLRSVAAWITAEKPPLGGRDTFSNNPLNTTLGLDGRGTGQVQQYSDLQTGINQNISTLNERPYTAVRAALAAGGGQPFFDALKASPWDADHYANRDFGALYTRAPLTADYTFQGMGAQKISFPATGTGGGNVAGDTPPPPTTTEDPLVTILSAQKKEADDALAHLKDVKEKVDAYHAAATDPKTHLPVENQDVNWLPKHNLTKEQMTALETEYDSYVGRPGGIGKEIENLTNRANGIGKALGTAQDRANRNQSPLFTTPGPGEKFILERNADGTLVLNPDGTPKTKLNPNYQEPKGDKPSVHVVSLPDQSFLVDDTGKVIQSFKKDPANETRVEEGFLVTYNPKTGDVVSRTDIRSELGKKAGEASLDELTAKATMAKLALKQLQDMTDALKVAQNIPDPAARKAALDQITDDYSRIKDPLAYAQNQAQQTYNQVRDMEDQTGFVYDFATKQPKLDPTTGQPILTTKYQNELQSQKIFAAQTAETQATQAASETEKYQARYLPAEAAAPFEAMNAAYASGKPIPAPGLVTYQARETPMEVHQRVYQSVLQALSPQSPLARQLLSQQTGMPDTVSTTGTPIQAAALNAMTTAGTVNGPAQGPPSQTPTPAQGPTPAVPGAGASPLALPPTPSQGQLEGQYGQVQPPPQAPAQPAPAPAAQTPPAPAPPLYQLFQQYGLSIGAAKAGALA